MKHKAKAEAPRSDLRVVTKELAGFQRSDSRMSSRGFRELDLLRTYRPTIHYIPPIKSNNRSLNPVTGSEGSPLNP